MLRKLIRTVPAALLAAGLVVLPAAAGTGLETAWPPRFVDLFFAWFSDVPRTGIAASEGAVPLDDPAEVGSTPRAGAPAPDEEVQAHQGESGEGEVAPSLDPNG